MVEKDLFNFPERSMHSVYLQIRVKKATYTLHCHGMLFFDPTIVFLSVVV